jgi:hypothetical protein
MLDEGHKDFFTTDKHNWENLDVWNLAAVVYILLLGGLYGGKHSKYLVGKESSVYCNFIYGRTKHSLYVSKLGQQAQLKIGLKL